MENEGEGGEEGVPDDENECLQYSVQVADGDDEDEGGGEGEGVPDNGHEFPPNSVQVADDTLPLPIEDEDNLHMEDEIADAQIEQAMDDRQPVPK